jgi:hypothetical protein
MRSGVVLLPRTEDNLCARVLLLAEYLGMDDFIAHVKAKAWAAMRPDEATADDARDLASAFSEEVGSLQDAINSAVLPARFFGPEPKPPHRRHRRRPSARSRR